MARVSAVEWARMRRFSPQYARRRLKEIGAQRGPDHKYDYAAIEALHAGENPPAAPVANVTSTGEPHESKASVERRLIAAKAERAETENRVRAGELVSAVEVTSEFGKMITAVRQRLLSIGHKLAPALAVEEDALACQALIDDEVYQALAEFAGFKSEGQ